MCGMYIGNMEENKQNIEQIKRINKVLLIYFAQLLKVCVYGKLGRRDRCRVAECQGSCKRPFQCQSAVAPSSWENTRARVAAVKAVAVPASVPPPANSSV